MNESDVIRLRHMLDAAREALSFIAGRSSEDLSRDRMLVLALVKEIEIIGEAASRISDESRKALPRIPWPKIVAMRNRLIHAYADVDLSIVWDTLTGALPELLRELENALAG
jgi:uncharacterized protein with HEPN domain